MVAEVGAGVGAVVERAAVAGLEPQGLVQERQGARRLALPHPHDPHVGPQGRILGAGLDGLAQQDDGFLVAVLLAQGMGQVGPALHRVRRRGQVQAQQLLGDVVQAQAKGDAAEVPGQGGIAPGGFEGGLVGVQRRSRQALVLGPPGPLQQGLHLVPGVVQRCGPSVALSKL